MAKTVNNIHKYDAIITNVTSVKGIFKSARIRPNVPANKPIIPVGISNTKAVAEADDTTVTHCLLHFTSFFNNSNLGRFSSS